MPPPIVSIVIPHLADAHNLARCLAAIGAQHDPPPFEVVVVDNGSADLPVAVTAEHPFATLLKEPTPGPGPARSLGAHRSVGRYLAFIDADCVPEPDWLRTIVDHLDETPGTSVLGGDVSIEAADPARPSAIESYEQVFAYRMQLYVEEHGYAATCNMAVRRAVFEVVGDFAGIDIAEDRDWGQRATALDFVIEFVPQMRVRTPARSSFAEVARKLDRQCAHDRRIFTGRALRLRWVVRSLAMPLSALADVGTIARSTRLRGLRERVSAWTVLLGARTYKGFRMLRLLGNDDGSTVAAAWRRPIPVPTSGSSGPDAGGLPSER